MPPCKTYNPFGDCAEWHLRDAIGPRKRLLNTAFIILDEQTGEDKWTCQLVSRKEAHYFSVRSDFWAAQRCVDAIVNESTNIQRLRNEAAMCGGILQNDRVPTVHVMNRPSDVSFFNKPITCKTWNTCCGAGSGWQDKIILPVFVISELPLKVCANFLGMNRTERC